jgi:hypothetical protein
MAPVSHLLVYYVTEAGEPISDVINFGVKLLLRQVNHQLAIQSFSWFLFEVFNL